MANKKMIDSLTPEQEAKIPEYVERFKKIGLSTEPCDRPKAEAALRAIYKYFKYNDPEIVWADSPYKGIVLAAQTAKDSEDVTKEEIRAQASQASFGSFEAYWVSLYSFIANELPVERDELLAHTEEVVKNCGVFWTFDGRIIVTEKPTAIHLKDDKLHNTEGLALEYKDGTGMYCVEGSLKESLMDLVLSDKFENESNKA